MTSFEEWEKEYVAPWSDAFRKFLIFALIGTVLLAILLNTEVWLVQIAALTAYVYGICRYAKPVFQLTIKQFRKIISEK